MLSSGNVSNANKEKRIYAGVVGRDWTQSEDTIIIPLDISCQDDGSSVFLNANGTKAIYRSKNYGKNWSAVTTPYIYSRPQVSADGNKIITADWGTSFIGVNGTSQGRIWVSTNNGTNWTERRYDNAQYQYFYTCGISKDGTKMYACIPDDFGYPEIYGPTSSPDSGIYKSTDDGATWTRMANSPQASSPGQTNNRYSFGSIGVSGDGNVLYGSIGTPNTGRIGYIYKSTDAGVNWTLLSNTTEREWWYYALSYDGSIVYAVRYGSDYIYRSFDQGATWTTVNTIEKYGEINCSSNGKNVFVVTADSSNNTGKVFTSNDYGETWIQQNNSSRFNRGIVCTADGDIAYKTYSITDGYSYTSKYV